MSAISAIQELYSERSIFLFTNKTNRKLISVILDLENVPGLENFKKIINYKLSLK